MGRFLGETLFGNLIRPFGPPSGAAARPTLKMIHWIIFQALRPPCEGKAWSGSVPPDPFRESHKRNDTIIVK